MDEDRCELVQRLTTTLALLAEQASREQRCALALGCRRVPDVILALDNGSERVVCRDHAREYLFKFTQRRLEALGPMPPLSMDWPVPKRWPGQRSIEAPLLLCEPEPGPATIRIVKARPMTGPPPTIDWAGLRDDS